MRRGGLAPVLYCIYPLLIYSWRPSQSLRRLLIILVDSIRYQARLSAIYVVHESVFFTYYQNAPVSITHHSALFKNLRPLWQKSSIIPGQVHRWSTSFLWKSKVYLRGNWESLHAIAKTTRTGSDLHWQIKIKSPVGMINYMGSHIPHNSGPKIQPTAPVKPMVSVL